MACLRLIDVGRRQTEDKQTIGLGRIYWSMRSFSILLLTPEFYGSSGNYCDGVYS